MAEAAIATNPRPRVQRNLIANVAGSIWTTLIGIAFFPVYIRYLGVEAYGLIGVFTSLQAFSALIDAGFGATINREVARLSAEASGAKPMRDLVRTMEFAYWALSCIAGVTLAVAAPFLAAHWVHPVALSELQVARALMLMGINFALLWPSTIYLGGLLGLQYQVRMNVTMMILGGARSFGAVAVLVLVSPTLEAFFIWQILMSALQTVVVGILLWRSMPKCEAKAAFNLKQLDSVKNFTLAVIAITLLSLALQQSDKLILSNLLTLKAFGYYTFAGAVAVTLARIVGPIHSTFFPRFAELVGAKNDAELSRVYHRACQLVSVAVLPVSVILALFAKQILTLWTRNPDLVANAHLLVTVLVIGNTLHALVYLPYAMQLAHGWTRLGLVTNLIAVVVLLPGIALATTRWGALGAAGVWVILTASYVFVQVPVMHRRLLRGELLRWYVDDVGKPLAAALAVAVTGRLLAPHFESPLAQVATLAFISAVTLAAAAMTVPWIRRSGLNGVRRARGFATSLNPASSRS
jgi:O-antigen/teichoic acid export membrane protein